MQHIGFILDGNRTWAKKRGLPTLEGHRRGYNNTKRIIEAVLKEGIPYLSLWVLSTSNIRERSAEEVSYLFDLLEKGIRELETLSLKNNIRIQTVGDLSLLPISLQNQLAHTLQKTIGGSAMTLVIAIAYGGQNEIVRGVRQCLEKGIDPEILDEKSFFAFLDSGAFPPPDLVVRTGGHSRHSGFFLYAAEYSEYYFTDILWPDFDEDELYRALNSFSKATRKFGK